MSSIPELREQLEMHKELLAATNEFLLVDPNDADTLQSKAETEQDISRIEKEIAALSSQNTVPLPPPTATQRHAPPPPPPAASPAPSFTVGEHVMAKYSEDQSFYAAVVLSKTGNPSDPLYTVKFTSYGNTETIRKADLKAMDASRKRKAEESAASHIPPPPPPPPSGVSGPIISAGPAIDANLTKKRVPSMVSDGPTRLPREPKKLKSNKALDKAKSNWQTWQKSGPKVKGEMTAPKQKESQFRVSDRPGAKVGFTGSGQGMQKDAARSVWKYTGTDD